MATNNLPTFQSTEFDVRKCAEGWLFTQEASSLVDWTPAQRTIMVQGKQRTLKFQMIQIKRDADGDVQMWEYRNSAHRCTVMIYND